MIDFPALADMVDSTSSKIIMLVVDGLGGAPHPDTGLSELETAALPNLDRLAKESSGGLTIPVLPGVAPGQRVRAIWLCLDTTRSNTSLAGVCSKL